MKKNIQWSTAILYICTSPNPQQQVSLGTIHPTRWIVSPVLAHILTGLAMHFIFHFYFYILCPRQDGCLFTQVSILLLAASGPFFCHATFKYVFKYALKAQGHQKQLQLKSREMLPAISSNGLCRDMKHNQTAYSLEICLNIYFI